MSKRLPEGWRRLINNEAFQLNKGSVVKAFSDSPARGYAPYLLIESFNGAADRFVRIEKMTLCDASDPLLVMDGSRSGLVLRGRSGVIGSTLASVVPKDCSLLSKDFLFYYLSSLYNFLNGGKTAGAVPHVDRQTLMNLPIFLPPLPEQEKIAEILGAVDTAIDSIRRVIEQTRFLKRALTQELLTKGIPGRHKSFKDSPLGKIPEKWSVAALDTITDLQTGFPFKSLWFDDHSEIRLLRGENVGVGKCDWAETRRIDAGKHGSFEEYMLGIGDIIIGMDRTFTKAGYKLTRIVEEDLPAILVQRVGRFVPIECDLEYLFCILKSDSYISQIKNNQKGSDLPHLSKTEILEPKVPVPPQEEQAEIAALLTSFEQKEKDEQVYLAQLHSTKRALMQGLLSGDIRVSVDQKQKRRNAA